jgi:uncharacterized membrane protein YkvA (DUF1232 family)
MSMKKCAVFIPFINEFINDARMSFLGNSFNQYSEIINGKIICIFMSNYREPLFERLKKHTRNLQEESFALFLAYKDPRTPWYAKVFTGLVVAYAFSPIDLIPDFIPVLGYLDDLILVPLGIRAALKMIPPDVLSECRAKAQIEMSKGKPVNWAAAIAIVAVWVIILVLIVKWVRDIAS